MILESSPSSGRLSISLVLRLEKVTLQIYLWSFFLSNVTFDMTVSLRDFKVNSWESSSALSRVTTEAINANDSAGAYLIT